MPDESQPIDLDNLMTMFEAGQDREVIHELATQLCALQREFYELKAGGLTIHELRSELRNGLEVAK